MDFCDETTGTDLGTMAQLTNSLDGTYGAALSVANLDVEDHYVTATYERRFDVREQHQIPTRTIRKYPRGRLP